MRVFQYVSEWQQDSVFAIRQMLANRALTSVAVVTLAIGIGATTAIFSAVHAVVLRPLPIPQPERVVVVNEAWRDLVSDVSASIFLEIAAEQEAFESIAALQRGSFTLARQDSAERLVGSRVTGGFFDVFRVHAAVGRVFGVVEDQPGREQVVVLSHRLWRRQFGGDPRVVGRQITLNQRPYIVLGVTPASFDLTSNGDELWVPIAFTPERRANRDEHYLTVYGRLRAGVSRPQATERLGAVAKRRAHLYPKEDAERSLRITPLMEQFVGDYRQRLFVLLGAVGFVLLIACANVSNLLLARGAARARELAMRSALGAGPGRLVRQLFTESFMLGLTGAAAGVLLASWLIELLIAFSPAGVPRIEQTRVDGAALGLAVLIALAASILFGLAPALRASRTDVNRTLKEAGRSAGSGGPRDALRSMLITAEVALALVLLVGAGLLIRSALETERIQFGIEPHGVFTGRFLLPETKYAKPASLLRVTEEIEEAVARIPGVQAAAVASTIPSRRSFSNGLIAEGLPLEARYVVQSDGVMISPAYFRTLGIRILRGRPFEASDGADSPLVVIINETLARQMWPGDDPIGKRLTSANPKGPAAVVGIVRDVRLGGPSESAPPTFYVPLAQQEEIGWSWTERSLFIVARVDGEPAALALPTRSAISSIDPAVALYDTATMDERMAATIETARFNTMLLTGLGIVGLLLAAVGIYAVIAYFATERTSEIGIRMALGASRRDVMHLVVGQAATPVLAGVAFGTLGALFASRVIAAQLVNVRTTDPLTFAAVAAALVLVALGAALIPARRAASIDPTRALHTI